MNDAGDVLSNNGDDSDGKAADSRSAPGDAGATDRRERDARANGGAPGRASAHESGSPVNGKRPSGERLRIIIADPDPLARRVIRDSLHLDGGFIVAAEAKDGIEAVELALHYRPELVLMEIGMPGLDGIGACREITAKAPQVHVVMFSVPQDRDVEIRALRAGAGGFLSKNADIEAVARALRSVAAGEAAVSRSLTNHLVELLRTTAENGSGMRPVKSPLTTREWEVLDLICAGNSTREISGKLFLSEDTVYSHTKSILRKLGVHSRVEAAAVAGRLRQPKLS
jgi:DNA-binding NarL/FixJ family response regulator